MTSSAAATIWRHDGVINYIVPEGVLVDTFLLLLSNHSTWLCNLVNEMAYLIDRDTLVRHYPDDGEVLYKAIQKGLDDHGEAVEGRMHSDPQMFEGMIYGTMHPVELASIAEVCESWSDRALADGVDPSRLGVIEVWRLAFKKFVRPVEALASVRGTPKETQ